MVRFAKGSFYAIFTQSTGIDQRNSIYFPTQFRSFLEREHLFYDFQWEQRELWEHFTKRIDYQKSIIPLFVLISNSQFWEPREHRIQFDSSFHFKIPSKFYQFFFVVRKKCVKKGILENFQLYARANFSPRAADNISAALVFFVIYGKLHHFILEVTWDQ